MHAEPQSGPNIKVASDINRLKVIRATELGPQEQSEVSAMLRPSTRT